MDLPDVCCNNTSYLAAEKKSLHQKKDFPVIPNTNKVRYMHDPISIYNNLVSDDVIEHNTASFALQ
jgi:hypothetical protein